MNTPGSLEARIARAKELLAIVKHGCMATTNEDGTPHATPFYLILDTDLRRVYFGSHPDSQHSKNVARTGELFVVLYDAIGKGGGLYLRAKNGQQLAGDALVTGLAAHNATRARDGKAPLDRKQYEGDNPQRMYGADIVALWVNIAERDANNLITKEYRREITAANLLS